MIRSLRKFTALSPARRRLLLRCVGTLSATRLQLTLFRFDPAAQGRPVATLVQYSPQEIAWAIEAAGRIVPAATCLVKALAAQAVLARCGHCSRIRIGVAPGRPAARTLDAHAWLECDGMVLIGGHDSTRYRSLVAIDSRLA